MTKAEKLKEIQTHINEYWESLDKEDCLMRILNRFSEEELDEFMEEEDIWTV